MIQKRSPAEDIYAMIFKSLGSIAFCTYDVMARQDRKPSTFPKDLSEVTDKHTQSSLNEDENGPCVGTILVNRGYVMILRR